MGDVAPTAVMTDFAIAFGAIVFWELLVKDRAIQLLRYLRGRSRWRRLAGRTPDYVVHASEVRTADGKKAIRQSDVIVDKGFAAAISPSGRVVNGGPLDLKALASNVLIIGSPKYTADAEPLQRWFFLPFEFVVGYHESASGIRLSKLISAYGEEYLSSEDLKESVDGEGIDYAVIFVGSVDSHSVLWLAGIHGYGTVGAWRHFRERIVGLLSADFDEGVTGRQWLLRVHYQASDPEAEHAIRQIEVLGDGVPVRARGPMKPPRVLICDFGNVLMFFDRSRTYRALGHVLGLSYRAVRERIEANRLRERFERGEMDELAFYECIMSLFETGHKVDYEVFKEAWSDIFWPNKNMIEALRGIANKVTLVLLSNTNSLHFDRAVEHYGDHLALFGRRMVLSYREKVAKPDRAIYERAMKIGGEEVSPGECLFVDDQIEYVDAAKRLGMEGIVYVSHARFVHRMRRLGLYVR